MRWPVHSMIYSKLMQCGSWAQTRNNRLSVCVRSACSGALRCHQAYHSECWCQQLWAWWRAFTSTWLEMEARRVLLSNSHTTRTNICTHWERVPGWVCACERLDRFMCGLRQFKLLTDHKPLVPLINNKPLDITPLRCQRLFMRLMRYNVKAEYSPGKSLLCQMLCHGILSTIHPCMRLKKMSTFMSTSSSPIVQSHRGREASCRHPREMMQLFSLQSAMPLGDGQYMSQTCQTIWRNCSMWEANYQSMMACWCMRTESTFQPHRDRIWWTVFTKVIKALRSSSSESKFQFGGAR